MRTTLLAAHTLPPEYRARADDYIELIAREWLPQLAAEGLIDAVDIFCERIAFSTAQAARLFAAARALAIPVKMHAEQLANLGGTLLATSFGALSCDHLEFAGAPEARALARAGTVAVLLPVAYYCLAEERRPPVAELRAAGAAMAVASDCNPGSAPGTSILLAMSMATRLFGLTAEEALLGVTREAARALGLGHERGTLSAGYAADFVVWNVGSLAELSYWIGFNPRRTVVRAGEVLRLAEFPSLKLGARPLHLSDLRRLYTSGVAVALDPAALTALEQSHAATLRIAAADAPAYGINTGFGLLANTRIPAAQRTLLQRNIILSHAAGVGPLLDDSIVRLTLVLKLASLAQGFSGVSIALARFLEALITKDLYPCVPAQGSVGASGDLAPLAHLSLVLLGQGSIRRNGEILPAAEALAAAGLTPPTLGPKEGLALLNGTQVSTALALAALFALEAVFAAAVVTGMLSTDAAAGERCAL